MVSKLPAKAVMKMVAKQFKLSKVLSYVEDPNDADKRIDELELDVFSLKKDVQELYKTAHEPREFIVCDCCNKKVKEKK